MTTKFLSYTRLLSALPAKIMSGVKRRSKNEALSAFKYRSFWKSTLCGDLQIGNVNVLVHISYCDTKMVFSWRLKTLLSNQMLDRGHTGSGRPWQQRAQGRGYILVRISASQGTCRDTTVDLDTSNPNMPSDCERKWLRHMKNIITAVSFMFTFQLPPQNYDSWLSSVNPPVSQIYTLPKCVCLHSWLLQHYETQALILSCLRSCLRSVKWRESGIKSLQNPPTSHSSWGCRSFVIFTWSSLFCVCRDSRSIACDHLHPTMHPDFPAHMLHHWKVWHHKSTRADNINAQIDHLFPPKLQQALLKGNKNERLPR